MSFKTLEDYNEAMKTWCPAPCFEYIEETGEFVKFTDNDLVEFQDPVISEIMGEVRLGDVRRMRQLDNRFRKADIKTFYEFRFFSCILKLEDNAFEGCSQLEVIALPQYLYVLGNHSFGGCSNLKELNFPDTLEIVADSALTGCSSLTSLTLPPNVKSIGAYAFNGCEALQEVKITSPLPPYIHDTTIFNGCDSLTSIYIPASVVGKYKSDHVWSKFGNIIKGI